MMGIFVQIADSETVTVGATSVRIALPARTEAVRLWHATAIISIIRIAFGDADVVAGDPGIPLEMSGSNPVEIIGVPRNATHIAFIKPAGSGFDLTVTPGSID